ncbi:MAG: hypothetical protein R2845_04480 [Thermomicrobiales bacterium]
METHIATMRERASRLDDLGLDAIHYEGPGVDLTVGLHPRHFWRVGAVPTSRATGGSSTFPPKNSSRHPIRLAPTG